MISYAFEPAADVPEEYARAIAEPGQEVLLRSDARQQVSVGLSQTFEGKRRPTGSDTSSANATKLRILSISTSPIVYDFEQAKKPGRTGWVTDAITNSFLSDLVPGFSLSLSHDLWEGQVGVDTARFDPFLQRVDASFAISENTLRAIGSIVGLGGKKDDAGEPPARRGHPHLCGPVGAAGPAGLVLQFVAGAAPSGRRAGLHGELQLLPGTDPPEPRRGAR